VSQKKTRKLKKGHAVAIAIGTFAAALIIWGVVFVQYKVGQVHAEGIMLKLPNTSVSIPASQVSFVGNGFLWIKDRASGKPTFDANAMSIAIADASVGMQGTLKNPDVTIQHGVATLDTSSAPGLALDQATANKDVAKSLNELQNQVIVQMVQEQPTVSVASARVALAAVQKILAYPIIVTINNTKQTISASTIGGWITQTPQDGNDVVSFDAKAITASLQQLAAPYSQPEQDLDFDYDSNNNAINVTAPKDGIGIDGAQSSKDLVALLESRMNGTATTAMPTYVLALQTVPAGVSSHAQSLGIEQLIGTATTPFAGSTKNRIHNITTGAIKLNGLIVPAAQEFSTIHTLGDIGPETGYVEELVILGPNTVPAYGGGLCQVSTTLFRAILNAGLPITERQNHSYRVSFYEKDGDGNSIGPGLDATIYDPSPDLKFINDTGHPVMITDQIVGTKITFNLYGTSDGRSSTIIGPTIVRTIPAPAPETVYSATLPAGEVKQTEFSHTGADTTATYEIHYPDGTTKTQIFNSHYHGLPAVYITNDPSAATPAVAPNGSAAAAAPATPAD
jgi:vancomycin resistance protein YoaR